MASVAYDHASRTYPGNPKPSVDQLNLEIADGEFLVLVGPSGCGKSTALRMLAGLEDINAGRILIGGRDVTRVPPKDRDIAMVFQNYALYPHMTVADNMGFALKIAGQPKSEIRQRVEEAAKILDLEQYLDRKPKALSGGQRQRVAMGRAIVRKPQVFCMDEPLSNLDAKLRVSTRTQIASLQRRLGITTVYVTHDQIEAMTMGDRVAVLKDGILQQCDTPRHMYDKPNNVFVAGFIGSPAMNLLQTTLDGDLVHLGAANVQVPRAGDGRAGLRPVGPPRGAARGPQRRRRGSWSCPPRSMSSRSSAPTRTSTAAPRSAASAARSSRGSTGAGPRRRARCCTSPRSRATCTCSAATTGSASTSRSRSRSGSV